MLGDPNNYRLPFCTTEKSRIKKFLKFFEILKCDLFLERDDDFVMNLTLLLSLSFAQCVAIYIYLSGFLLKRTSLPNQTSLNNSTLPPSYQKIVILLGNVNIYKGTMLSKNSAVVIVALLG